MSMTRNICQAHFCEELRDLPLTLSYNPILPGSQREVWIFDVNWHTVNDCDTPAAPAENITDKQSVSKIKGHYIYVIIFDSVGKLLAKYSWYDSSRAERGGRPDPFNLWFKSSTEHRQSSFHQYDTKQSHFILDVYISCGILGCEFIYSTFISKGTWGGVFRHPCLNRCTPTLWCCNVTTMSIRLVGTYKLS